MAIGEESQPKCFSRCWSSQRATFPTWNGSLRVTPCVWSRWKVGRLCLHHACMVHQLQHLKCRVCRVCPTNYLHNFTGFPLNFSLFLSLSLSLSLSPCSSFCCLQGRRRRPKLSTTTLIQNGMRCMGRGVLHIVEILYTVCWNQSTNQKPS